MVRNQGRGNLELIACGQKVLSRTLASLEDHHQLSNIFCEALRTNRSRFGPSQWFAMPWIPCMSWQQAYWFSFARLLDSSPTLQWGYSYTTASHLIRTFIVSSSQFTQDHSVVGQDAGGAFPPQCPASSVSPIIGSHGLQSLELPE